MISIDPASFRVEVSPSTSQSFDMADLFNMSFGVKDFQVGSVPCGLVIFKAYVERSSELTVLMATSHQCKFTILVELLPVFTSNCISINIIFDIGSSSCSASTIAKSLHPPPTTTMVCGSDTEVDESRMKGSDIVRLADW
jgi:hypothetical protein